jgi:hypothetical protein
MNTSDDEAFPAHPDGITAEWLTEALAPRYPGVRVAAVELLETHEVTNSHARLRIDYADPGTGDAPTLVFCKVPPSDPSRRQTTSIVGMGQREVRFYAGLADQVSMRVPEVYVARYSERDGSFLLLM